MSKKRIEEVKRLLLEEKRVYVGDLSSRFQVSEVSVRKYLAELERQGYAVRFYGGAALADSSAITVPGETIFADPIRNALAHEAKRHVENGDSIFVGSGMTCCAFARVLTGFSDLTVFTNNITALPELVRNATRVYLIGGEVTTTDSHTLFSSWESPNAHLENIFVNKAFTSVSGIDVKAGLTVDSVISTHIFRQIPAMAHRWYLIADSRKFDKISIYPVARLNQIHTLITEHVPSRYRGYLKDTEVRIVPVR